MNFLYATLVFSLLILNIFLWASVWKMLKTPYFNKN